MHKSWLGVSAVVGLGIISLAILFSISLPPEIPADAIQINTDGTVQVDISYAPSIAPKWTALPVDGLVIEERDIYNEIPKAPAKHVFTITAKNPGVYLFTARYGIDSPNFSEKFYKKHLVFSDDSDVTAISISLDSGSLQEIITEGLIEVRTDKYIIEEFDLQLTTLTPTMTPVS